MRHILPMAVMLAGLAGCLMHPGSRYDPQVPKQTSDLKPINPYKTDPYPDTAYEIWRRDTDRNDQIAGKNGDTYPPLFKGQRDDSKGTQK